MLNALIAIGILFGAILFPGCSSTVNRSKANSVNFEQINITIPEITETATFYKYESQDKTVSFFAVKSFGGKIKVAFNACDVCYPEKKGYRQEGNYMVCNYCGLKFSINEIGTENKVGGGCWPSYLPFQVRGNNIVIEKSALEDGKWRF